MRVWEDAEARAHFQQHLVISLTFKDARASTLQELEAILISIIAAEVRRHAELESSPALNTMDRELFQQLGRKQADRAEFQRSLLSLSGWLLSRQGGAGEQRKAR